MAGRRAKQTSRRRRLGAKVRRVRSSHNHSPCACEEKKIENKEKELGGIGKFVQIASVVHQVFQQPVQLTALIRESFLTALHVQAVTIATVTSAALNARQDLVLMILRQKRKKTAHSQTPLKRG